MWRLCFAIFLFLLMFSCKSPVSVKKETVNKNIKGQTVEEMLENDLNWELIDDSLMIDGVWCRQYVNKKTGQIICVVYE